MDLASVFQAMLVQPPLDNQFYMDMGGALTYQPWYNVFPYTV